MSLAVVFFVGATVSTLLVGFSFARTRQRSVSYVGWGLVATGIAFGFWTIARVVNPEEQGDLEIWVTIGVFFLLVGLLSFLLSWATSLHPQERNLVLVAAVLYAVVLIAVRSIYPSEPFIDEDGVLFFNPHGAVAALEIGALTGAVLPAIFEIARRLRALYALIAKVAITTLLVSGIVLTSSLNKVLITIASVVMAAALLALLGAFVVRQPRVWLEGVDEAGRRSGAGASGA
jgi:hypothetical protein